MKLKLIFLFLFSQINVFSQNLTLDEFLSLRSKKFDYIENYLTKKGWEFLNIENKHVDDELYIKQVNFAFKKSIYSDKAESFFSYSIMPLGTNMISMQVNTKEKYLNFMTRIQALGYKVEESTTDNGVYFRTYKRPSSAKTTITVEIRSEKGQYDFSPTSTSYEFSAYDIDLMSGGDN